MPSRTYALERGGPERLQIYWRGQWKNVRVYLDGREIGTVSGSKELRHGREFPLGDGSMLRVQYVDGFFSPELRLLRDGQPLPGSESDPTERLRMAAALVYLIAGLNLLLGLAAELYGWERLRRYGFSSTSVVFGGVFLVLGFSVWRRSLQAMKAAIGLFVLDSVAMLILTAVQSGRLPVGVLLIRLFLFARMLPGVGAIRELRAGEAGRGTPPGN
jgi:hypothetical protein